MSTLNDLSVAKQTRLLVEIPDNGKGKITKEFLMAELVNEGIVADVKDGDWEVAATGNGVAEILVNYQE